MLVDNFKYIDSKLSSKDLADGLTIKEIFDILNKIVKDLKNVTN